MSNLPPNPYDRAVIVEPTLDTPDRAPLGGTGRDFVVSLTTSAETPGAESMFLSRTGHWVSFASAELPTWGSIIGDIENQADLWAELQARPLKTEISQVGYTGQYAHLLNKPVLGNISTINTTGETSKFLRADGTWQIPVDVYATWGNISGDINAQTDLIQKLSFYSPSANPIFTGNPRAPVPPVDNNTDSIATTSWFFGQAFNAVPVMDGVGSSGDSTRWARGNHRHPTDTTRAPLDSPNFIGLPTAPTPAAGNDSQLLATTAFVKAALLAGGGGGGGGGFTNSETPPVTPTLGWQWYVPSTARIYTWVNDGNSDQWVEFGGGPMGPPGPPGPPGTGGGGLSGGFVLVAAYVDSLVSILPRPVGSAWSLVNYI